MIPEAPDEPQPGHAIDRVVLRIQGEYRRSCLYAAVGLLLACALAIALRPGRQGNSPAQVVPLVMFVAGVVLLWLYVQTWRLRIDGTGIARRRLGKWSYWTWRDFSDGRVRVGQSPLSFWFPARPWWDRWLVLEFVEPDDAANRVAKLLRSLIPAPPAELPTASKMEAPDEIAIGLGLSTRLRITASGIEFQRGRVLRWIAWDQVDTLRLIREPINRAIKGRLDLRLGDGEAISGNVASVRIDGRRIWAAGDRKADWPLRLECLVPPRRWQVFSTIGELRSREEGEFRLAHFRDKLALTRRQRAIVPPVLLLLGGLVFVPKLIANWNVAFFPPWWKAVAVICLVLCMVQPAVMVWAILHFGGQALARRLRETERQMAELAGEGSDVQNSKLAEQRSEPMAGSNLGQF